MLGIVTYQDFRYRHIHIILPIIIFIISFFLTGGNLDHMYIIMPNLLFLLLTVGFLVLYMSIKNKAFLNPFANYFGLGDLLFFAGITPLFLLKGYIVFFIMSMVFSIVAHFVVSRYFKVKSVPLAGYVAILLLLVTTHDIVLTLPQFTILPQVI